MSIASQLIEQHFATLVSDNAEWQTLLADDILWELPYAPGLGHPTRLEGRDAVVRHVGWFLAAVENFAFSELRVHEFANPNEAAAEVNAQGLIKATGRIYRQRYVLFLSATDGKVSALREYFDPIQAAKALDAPIVGL